MCLSVIGQRLRKYATYQTTKELTDARSLSTAVCRLRLFGKRASPASPDFRRDDELLRGRAVARTARCGAESTRSAAHRTDALPRATRARRWRHPHTLPLTHRRPADAAPTCTGPSAVRGEVAGWRVGITRYTGGAGTAGGEGWRGVGGRRNSN